MNKISCTYCVNSYHKAQSVLLEQNCKFNLCNTCGNRRALRMLHCPCSNKTLTNTLPIFSNLIPGRVAPSGGHVTHQSTPLHLLKTGGICFLFFHVVEVHYLYLLYCVNYDYTAAIAWTLLPKFFGRNIVFSLESILKLALENIDTHTHSVDSLNHEAVRCWFC